MEHEQHEAEEALHRLLKDALEFDVDEASLEQKIRMRMSQRPHRSEIGEVLSKAIFCFPIRTASLCVAFAFLIGIVLPQPVSRPDQDVWINLALGETSILMLSEPRGSGARTEMN